MLKIMTLPGGLSALLINLYEDRRQTYGLRPIRQYGVGQIRKCLKPASRAILAAQLDCTCIATSQWRELSQRWQDARSALLSVIGLLYNGTGWPSSKKATSELSQIILIQTCPLREKGTTFQISFECGSVTTTAESSENNIVSYEFLRIRWTCDSIQLNACYCTLFTSR